MTQTLDVSIIIVSWNTRDVLRTCLASIYSAAGPVSFEVIVVDNASRDASADMVATEFAGVRLIRNVDNFGFAAANNQGLEFASGRYALLLNSDTVVLDGAIAEAVAFSDRTPDAAIVGCRTIFPDGRMQRNCFLFPSVVNIFLTVTKLSQRFKAHPFFGRYRLGWWDYQSEREVDGVAGCFMLVRQSAIERVGPMAEHYFMYAEDADWCWRFRKAGYTVWYTPQPCIVHLHDASASQAATAMRVQYRKSILAFIEQRSGPWARWACSAIFLGTTAMAFLASLCGAKRGANTDAERTASRRGAYECLRLHVRELFPWRPSDGSDPGLVGRGIALTKRCLSLAISAVFEASRRLANFAAEDGRAPGRILYYHGVTASQQERFRRQLAWLRTRRSLVPLSTVLQHVQEAAAITFDDGFENVRQFALPVLRELGIPATVFAVAGQLGRTPQWDLPHDHADAKERLMTADAIAKLCGDQIQIESHTRTHPRLSALSSSDALNELTCSRAALQSICGTPVRYVSMPYGDWSLEVLDCARKAGYERVFTSDPIPVAPSADSYAVGRTAVSPDDWMWEFKLKALGAYEWKRWLRQSPSRTASVVGDARPTNATPPHLSGRGAAHSSSSNHDALASVRK